MGKRKLILTKEQFERLCEGEEFNYLSDLATKPDMGDFYTKEVSAEGSGPEGEYADNVKTDDKAASMAIPWRGNSKAMASTLRECSKNEWLKKNDCNEEEEHGNARLKNRTFGGGYNDNGKSYDATKMAVSRQNAAKEKLNSNNPEERASGAETLRKMHQNWGNLDIAADQYENAKLGDKIMQQGKPIKSAPKQSGNGKAHSPKNGVFLN